MPKITHIPSSSPLLDDAQLVYIYDGSLEGLLSGIFAAYQRHEEPVNMVVEEDLQESMLCSYVPIATTIAHAVRVQKGLERVLGSQGYEDIKQVFLSDDATKGGVIYRFIRYAMPVGHRALSFLAEPAVADFLELRKRVRNEAHAFLQFVRFSQLENGVFFARIQPQASVVPLITEHFARRLNVQPFIIYDSVHHLASVFDTQKWWLVDAQTICLPGISQAEQDYQALWQTFFDTIAIEERRNPRCQRNFMPKRFWGNMCEHVPSELRTKRPQTATPSAVARQAFAGKAQPAQHSGHQLPGPSEPQQMGGQVRGDEVPPVL